MTPLDVDALRHLLTAILFEDLRDAVDLTSAATVPTDARMQVEFVTRQPGVVCGLPVVAALISTAIDDGSATFVSEVEDGERVIAGQRLATLDARARDVLALERTALNLLGHLSGVASITRAWVDAVAGTGARIRDTRKTMPLLRDLEKYAVRCGGGVNHRAGLYDAILIKDNHIAAAGGVGKALDAAYAAHPRGSMVVQVEVDTFDQLDEALAHGAEQILLDNFTVDELRIAVERTRSTRGDVLLEASGGLRLDTAREVAMTGVDYLAVGALTHSASALDIGLDHLSRGFVSADLVPVD
jgi:nicotinate-nucleotide pyrophosphorylase (carboxylating)